MYRYYFKTFTSIEYCFSSKYHISEAKVVLKHNATAIHFEDANMFINIAKVKEMRINGEKCDFKQYQV